MVQKTSNFYLLIIFLLLGFNIVNAQLKTSYEKQVLNIEKKYVKKILIAQGKWTRSTENELTNANSDYIVTALSLGLLTSPQFVESLKKELKQAANLKTSVDYQREKKEIEIRQQKIKTANTLKEKEGKLQKHQEEQELHKKTDLGIIENNIKEVFKKWNQKGEFEKNIDYEERLKNNSKDAFSQICFEEIKRKIGYYNYDYYLERELSKYNAEDEFFTIKFKINDVEWHNKLNIPISKAEDFKNNWPRLKIKIDEYNWCFVQKKLCPTLITSNNQDAKLNFYLTIENQNSITFSFDNFEIINPYLQGFVYKYSEDNIHQGYNKKLDSVYNGQNAQLLQNTNNLEKITKNNYEKVSTVNTESDNQVYNTAGIEVKPDFPGGMDKFYSFIAENYRSPKEEGLKGKVYVTFVIEKNGSLTDIKVLRDIGYETGKEAIRVLQKSPRWNPGIQNGAPIRCLYSLPISVSTD